MSSDYPYEKSGKPDIAGPEPEVILAELAPEPPTHRLPVRRIFRRRWRLPAILFVATCLTTLLAGALDNVLLIIAQECQASGLVRGFVYGGIAGLEYCWGYALAEGWKYALPLMTILICHEAGHFLQARRHGVYASYPYFIPMPLGFIGTFGAVIAMEPRMGNRRALFDIGITGPLAGLVPTLIFCVVGLHFSELRPLSETGGGIPLGEPLLFQLFTGWIFGPVPEGHDIILHPMAFAGWVGLLITALNLLPIGQLDGGHVLYALLRNKAWYVASLLLLSAAVAVAVAVVIFGYVVWIVMLFLLLLIGPIHPPTADDNVPLNPGRILLGWLTLAFVPIGLTLTPIRLGL